MKVLLIDPPGWQKHSINLGLCYLAGTLLLKNVEARILDMNNNSYSQSSLEEAVSNFNPGIIGISVKTATAKTCASIAAGLKKIFPGIIYVAGGPHITLSAVEFLKENRSFDFGIAGEGEVCFAELVSRLMDKGDISSISGLCYYRENSLVCNAVSLSADLSGLAFPRLECIANINFLNLRYPLLTSRGCPYGCIFCCVGVISGKKWRPRRPENVIGELIEAKSKYRIDSFEIMDDNFTFDLDRAKTICRLLTKERLSLDWWCHNGLRADKLDEEVICLMKEAGCKSIAIGIESGDETVFNNIKKGESLADITKAVKMIQKAGLQCVGYFITGLPGDSIAATKKTVRFQRQLGLSDHKYNIVVPYPGTRMREQVAAGGRFLLDIRETSHFGENARVSFDTDELAKETIEQCWHMANCQGWVYGEKDLQKIEEVFKTRHQRDIQRIVFIAEDDLMGISKNIQIEYREADIIEVIIDNSLDSRENLYHIKLGNAPGYFKEISKLSRHQEGGIIVNTSKHKLFVQNTDSAKEGYIRREELPDIRQWDNPEGKYYACRLKYFSPGSPLGENGIIYKDGISLPFSPAPQWEKQACGKLESGIAFISLSAYDPGSVYTADYFSARAVTPAKELRPFDAQLQGKDGDKSAFLETIFRESDILFVPESLAVFAGIFSRAKINARYYRKDSEKFALGYEILEPFFSLRAGIHKIRKAKFHKQPKAFLVCFKQSYLFAGKAAKVMGLWLQIIILVSLTNFNRITGRIIKAAG